LFEPSSCGEPLAENICTTNIQRSGKSVNEMAIHICRDDALALLRARQKLKQRNRPGKKRLPSGRRHFR
jgi:hypothetical protein